MKMLTYQLGVSQGCLGVSLRGNCTTAADADRLAEATQRMLLARSAQLWIDCQRLQSISVLGQRALLRADSSARAMGTTCYWCGLPAQVLAQLANCGGHGTLQLLSAEEFQGPHFLLPRA